MKPNLTHFDNDGRPQMVDVSTKDATSRSATARGRVAFSSAAFAVLRRDGVKKGDILRIAEIAGVMAAKKTPDLIPLCHPLAISSVNVAAEFNDAAHAVDVVATVKVNAKTGVEMEALTAVSVACLTIYDMAKSIAKSMAIGPVELIEKAGGKSGDFRR
ncbi:MAG: cyclic pyranopterin monophosphate synthase MoaC [Parvularculaceae bacterium]|nr:cyclic pyranopterin monophosphate synthase MoaC [Parvularculaceae bacterium]